MNLLSVSGIQKQLSPSFTLQDIHFSQVQGQKIAITGDTGSGKSTILKIIAGLVQPDYGTVLFNTIRVTGPDEQLVPGHPQIAYLSQDHELRNNYRIEELLEYANKLTTEAAAGLYRLCRIDHLLKRTNARLSGGEKQRIALAKLLVSSPTLLLLDEPFSNLDLIHKNILKSVIEDIGGELKINCILTSHDPMDTLSWADTVIVLKQGRMIQQGPPLTVYTQPVNEYVAGLFGHFMLLDPAQAAILGAAIPEGNTLLVRPGDLGSSREGPGIQARVTGVLFKGDYQELTLDAKGTVFRINTPDRELNTGDWVNLYLLPGRGHLLAGNPKFGG